MLGFYLSMDCENCEEEILMGPCATTEERNGYPIIPFDFASQEKFVCPRCDARHYTGDFIDFVEMVGGRDTSDDEDEDDDDA